MYDEGAVPLSQFLVAENHTQIYTMFALLAEPVCGKEVQ